MVSKKQLTLKTDQDSGSNTALRSAQAFRWCCQRSAEYDAVSGSHGAG